MHRIAVRLGERFRVGGREIAANGHHVPDRADRLWRASGDGLCHGRRRPEHRAAVCCQFLDEADVVSPASVNPAAGQLQPQCLPEGDHPAEVVQAVLPQHSRARFGEPELRPLAGDADVAGQGQFEPAAERIAVDRRDDRLAACGQPGEQVRDSRVGNRQTQFEPARDAPQVPARGERAAVASAQHHRPQVPVRLVLIDGTDQGYLELIAERIACLRPLHADEPDMAGRLRVDQWGRGAGSGRGLRVLVRDHDAPARDARRSASRPSRNDR
jgi:hypothetical protein